MWREESIRMTGSIDPAGINSAADCSRFLPVIRVFIFATIALVLALVVSGSGVWKVS